MSPKDHANDDLRAFFAKLDAEFDDTGMYFVLDETMNPVPARLSEWIMFFESDRRQTMRDEDPEAGWLVSSIFVGMADFGGRPYFETMVDEGGDSEYDIERFPTFDDQRMFHRDQVARLRGK